MKIERSFGAHDGTFHADEVTACALLMMYNLIDRDKITRTRDPKVLAQCDFVCDVGGIYDPKQRLFDHHQVEYQGPLSSAGMILLYLKDQNIISEKDYHALNDALIIGVDAHDNGKVTPVKGFASFSNVVSNYMPIEHGSGEKAENEAFFHALDFVLAHLDRLMQRHRYQQSCQRLVEESMKDRGVCLMFDENLPWIESFFEMDGEAHPAQFVIMPSSGNQWKLRGIPPSYDDRMAVRTPLPLEWAGLLDDDLKAASNITGAIFCHKGRFISVWENREDAIKALEYTLAQTKK
ncbi:UPF0160 protein CT_386 [Chlamydiales bacterium SCGC AG-110-M15]|nr:UPF0160 protein CT_386 [Chlamydiales bacterium SCGC AG-110-M15]